MVWQVYCDPVLSASPRSRPSIRINTAGFGVLNLAAQTAFAGEHTHVEIYCTRDRARLAVKFIVEARPWALRLARFPQSRSMTFSLKSILRKAGLEALKGKRFYLREEGGLLELIPSEGASQEPEGPRPSWMLLDEQVRGRYKSQPVLRINANGMAFFNRMALRRFSAGRRFVELYSDGTAGRAAIRFVEEPARDVYHLVIAGKEPHSAFLIRPFLAAQGLTALISSQCILVPEGDLLALHRIEAEQ